MKTKEMRGNLLLLITAAIWGSAFVAQSVGMDYVGPFTFQAVRNLLGALALLPVILLHNRKKKRDGEAPMTKEEKKQLWIGGLVCGTVLGVAGCLQQIGVQHTTVGKAGFITALYILIVPVLGLLFHKKVPFKILGCIVIAVVGLYLLCVQDSFSLSKGDAFVALCALGFSVHIMVVDYYAARVDGLKLSCLQFFVAGLFSTIPTLLTEEPNMQGILNAWLPIVYGGVFSSGIGYTLQVLGQKYTKPTVASLLMSLESVFAVLAGIVLLGQIPTLRETIGCLLMFGAIVLAQLPGKEKTENRKLSE